ncbi:type II toxin-antitoxin system RelE/ParE family toxin [Romeria aff. gracilis LEGE 07310]|uniref:Type II toxin-antitoxin system RelE/ParE family toxin n=1 Tax=Vasconcelosia minhoensis LEGE 07310 TaxID=915328 RepID=A0A8J7AYY4_9CYAN|nr:type II toxin-antitoxin system RelE/ParE family toxin [Romeria aff. gracilis LEGE 07310]
MRRCTIARAASQDLDDIIDYFLSRNVDAGDRFIQSFNRKCQQLAQFPHTGRSYTEIMPELRGMPLQGYIIFYQVTDEAITILRVLSGYRDLRSVFLE